MNAVPRTLLAFSLLVGLCACESLTLELPSSSDTPSAGGSVSSDRSGAVGTSGTPSPTDNGDSSTSPGSGASQSPPPGATGATGVLPPGATSTGSGPSSTSDTSVPSTSESSSDPVVCVNGTCGLREGEPCDPEAEKPCAPGLWCPPVPDLQVQHCAPVLELGEDVQMRFIRIPAGTFLQGSPPPADANRRQWESTLTRPYFLAEVPVTQAQWAALANEGETSPSYGTAGRNGPVDRVTWYEAIVFANRVSEAAGLEPCYTWDDCFGEYGGGCSESSPRLCSTMYECTNLRWDRECTGYRLPTESEWERALRAGEEEVLPYFWGTSTEPEVVDEYAWYRSNTEGSAPAVGLLLPNPWGLYDMVGTIEEWVIDNWGAYPTGPTTDHVAASGVTSSFVARGGGYDGDIDSLRSFHRFPRNKTSRNAVTGFRLARTAPR